MDPTDYELALEGAPDTIPGGTGILLVHPSTGETDRIDTDESKADILDTLSVERGYSRRSSEHVHYVSRPEDLDGIVETVREFLETTEGKRRVSFDSITELAYYADEDGAREAVERILDLLEKHDAVALFHLAEEVHDDDVVAGYRELFDHVVTLDADGSVTVD